jgi:sugar/nucleoside kinase (ribokinase family)
MGKILIIGDSVLDKIYYNGKLTIRPGGIYHTVNTFINLAEAEDEFYLLTHYSEKSFKYFEKLYSKTNLTFAEIIPEIPIVSLQVYDNKEREEKYAGKITPLSIPSKVFSIDYDFILINMITGFDILPEDLEKLKRKTKAEVYFDLHTFSRGIDDSGNRKFRIIPSVENWLKNIDILQLNQNEIKTLWGINSEKENIEKLYKQNVDKVIITKGAKGVSCYYKTTGKNIAAKKVAAINSVGCGDSFGAAFIYAYSKNKNLFSAANFANFVAGIITTYASEKKYMNLKNDIAKKYN